MRTKNPLYVVKGNDVEEAQGVFDMLMKRFNLQPVMEFLMHIFRFLLENVKNYQTFIILKELLDDVMKRLELFKKFSII